MVKVRKVKENVWEIKKEDGMNVPDKHKVFILVMA